MKSIDEVWIDAIKRVMLYGISSEPRGIQIKEYINYSSCVDMNQPVLLNKARKLSYKFCCGEAAWILSGDNRLETILPYNSVMTRFSDDGIFLHGAYGPQIVDQLHYVIDTLNADSDSRQAVLTTWRPNPRASKDIPCTVSIQFLIRNYKLVLIDTMRSSDLWLGWSYDIFTFSMLARYVACCLNKKVELGNLYLNAGSSHIYEEHWTKALFCIADEQCAVGSMHEPNPIPTFSSPTELISWLKSAAQNNLLIK